MMRRLLKKIREIELINKAIRLILLTVPKEILKIFTELQKRWPVSGTVDCEFKDIKFKMYSKCDDGLAHYFFYKAKYFEESDLFLFKELSKSVNCVLDIGANTGLYSIVSSITNPHLEIYAFEPYPVNAERMRVNLNANNLKSVQLLQEAVGDKVGYVDIAIPANHTITDVASVELQHSKRSHPELNWKTVTVPVNTIDNFQKSLRLPIDLIKCDVETFEMAVFKGAYDTLKSNKPTIIFESILDEERRVFFNAILQNFNYYLYLILDGGIVYSENGFSENYGLNFLITPMKPKRNFISYNQLDLLRTELLLRQ
jgi:FkbM family methyltransferase